MRAAMSKRLLGVSIASVLGVVLAASGANAAKYGPGASDKEIVLGQTMRSGLGLRLDRQGGGRLLQDG